MRALGFIISDFFVTKLGNNFFGGERLKRCYSHIIDIRLHVNVYLRLSLVKSG